MGKKLLHVMFLTVVSFWLCGCETVYQAFIGVDGETKERFAAVPSSCESQLEEQPQISACTKELMPLGREYGLLALQRIHDYGEHALPETKKMLPEFKEKIEQNCFAQLDHADELFEEGEDDVATEIALGSLSDCFFRGDAVMERSYGGMDVEPLRAATDKALNLFYEDSLSMDYAQEI